MKWTSLFIAVAFGLGFADIIPGGSHWVEHNVFIANADGFPQCKVIGFIHNVLGNDTAYVVENTVKLFKGYKNNMFSLFAIRTNLLDSCGGVNGLNFQAINGHLTGASIVDPTGTTIQDDIPMVKDTYYYQIESVNNNTLILKLVKRIKHYSDGRCDEVEEF
jgi:hypothetical protein